MNLKKLVSGLKLKSIGRASKRRERIGKSDLGVLRVAFMVAALDGEVSAAEYEAFDLMARKCRGYTPEAAEEALRAAMRSAGFLMLLAKRVSDEELVKAFVSEAEQALPDGFAYLAIEDIRRAVVTWIAMGMSDGTYSVRESKCIEALRRCFAEKKTILVDAENERWLDLANSFGRTFLPDADPVRLTLITKDFVRRVEKLLPQYGGSEDAARELNDLLSSRPV